MYDPQRHNRKSIRLKGYDYSNPGYYYVTICTQQRMHLFGRIVKNQMVLNNCGSIAKEECLRTPQIRPYVKLDTYIIMPNHIHGILIITSNGRDVSRYAPTISKFCSPSKNLGAIIRGFKGAATTKINKMDNLKGRKIWQSNYYERIIRNDQELDNVRKYIQNNPFSWDTDKLNTF